MVGTMLLMAATALPHSMPASSAPKPENFRASSTATAHATARIMVISGAKFGQDYISQPSSGLRRSASLMDSDGQVTLAELLEFQ